MSLTVGQANAVNQIAKSLLSTRPGSGTNAVAVLVALESLSDLIPPAYKTLGAGYSPDRYEEDRLAWEKRLGQR